MTFEEWWEKPVEGSEYSKEEIAGHVKHAMWEVFGESLDLKVCMEDAWDSRHETLTYHDLLGITI